MSSDGYLPPGVSHEDVERAAGAWDEEEPEPDLWVVELRESIANGLEKVGCAGCSVLRPFRSHRSPAGPGEHEPECPVALAERVRAGEWG